MPAQSEQDTLESSLEQHCDDVRAQLTSSKVTTRKVGPWHVLDRSALWTTTVYL